MSGTRAPRATATRILTAVVLLAGLALAITAARWFVGRASWFTDRERVTQAVVVQRTRDVARLVTSETTLRDVLVYENSRYGSTKRALVVVTGRVLAGIDLTGGADVRVDEAARRIHVSLPQARVLGVEVTDLRTYDERSGLWNPFRPADRDSIFRRARAQLVTTAGELETARRAETSARRLLTSLLTTDGYTVEVTVRGRTPPLSDSAADSAFSSHLSPNTE
ncbi:MAG: DUF4230 domain-containing protein [Gemmatimonadaceae bacterium]|nr:DUF4230 domain-containing protein [Gemmatimonadaceae bacterium]